MYYENQTIEDALLQKKEGLLPPPLGYLNFHNLFK
jgi:hypothetical protein